MHMGFNRDIVECKERPYIIYYRWYFCFNRDIVECKERESENLPPRIAGVLIET